MIWRHEQRRRKIRNANFAQHWILASIGGGGGGSICMDKLMQWLQIDCRQVLKCETMKVLLLSIIHLEQCETLWLLAHHTESLSYVLISAPWSYGYVLTMVHSQCTAEQRHFTITTYINNTFCLVQFPNVRIPH